MKITPKYPKTVLKNPFFSGILVGYFIASGFNLAFFLDYFYGISLLAIGITYFYIKNKEFNKSQ